MGVFVPCERLFRARMVPSAERGRDSTPAMGDGNSTLPRNANQKSGRRERESFLRFVGFYPFVGRIKHQGRRASRSGSSAVIFLVALEASAFDSDF